MLVSKKHLTNKTTIIKVSRTHYFIYSKYFWSKLIMLETEAKSSG